MMLALLVPVLCSLGANQSFQGGVVDEPQNASDTQNHDPSKVQPLVTVEPSTDTKASARDTQRLTLGLAAVMFASYPNSMEDGGAALLLGTPLWLGERYEYFQWVADATHLAGAGGTSGHVHLVAGAEIGFNLYLGSGG